MMHLTSKFGREGAIAWYKHEKSDFITLFIFVDTNLVKILIMCFAVD